MHNCESQTDAETQRLREDGARRKNWKRWGPYLAERQWGTVREDYSADGSCWDYFTHDHARSRAYRWGEDGLLGICDRQCRLSFALAMWNGHDPILKERLFGLTNGEGNHGEDVKEMYFYLDSTPTHSYMKGLYKYPQTAFPYARLVEENGRRTTADREFELTDCGVFDEGRYFDVLAEYAKSSPNDVLIRITVTNRGPQAAPLHLLPTLWFRNTWIWGGRHEGCTLKPQINKVGPATVEAEHETLGTFVLRAGGCNGHADPPLLFTENETNSQLLSGTDSCTAFVKDAFHARVVEGRRDAVHATTGTKVAAWYELNLAPGASTTINLRLHAVNEGPTSADAFGPAFDGVFDRRIGEADDFYETRLPATLDGEQKNLCRQAYAGILWSKQFYHLVVPDWISGDPPAPAPAARSRGRNRDWSHIYMRNVLSMPDKWEYPWFAAWDLAFHMISFARVDSEFAKGQLLLMLREWVMHPNGQIPAYEFNFSDVNPPVHAWACWRVYKMSAARGRRDRTFLAAAFHKLLLNFTWWVNRKDPEGNHLFSGGFLGLDNVGVFDRSHALPSGGRLEQADGTAWMAFYCGTMLAIALELAREDPSYEGLASKFFEHYVQIADAMNRLGGLGLWNEKDGFYYDQLEVNHTKQPLRVRSLVGLIPLCAAEVIERADLDRLEGFKQRMDWFLRYRKDLARQISFMHCEESGSADRYLLAIPTRERLQRVLGYMLDENEFLSPYGIRSLSRIHAEHPYSFTADGQTYGINYEPAESSTTMFGGNSNWRGPIWLPVNFLIIEALERYHHFYGDAFTVEFPTGSGRRATLREVAADIERRLVNIFIPDAGGRRAAHGDVACFADDPHFRDLHLFYEYFDGDTGRGCGASHQTGWTALVANCQEKAARRCD